MSSKISKEFKLPKEIYSSYGIDVEKALHILKNVPILIYCWQGDDVSGFENQNY